MRRETEQYPSLVEGWCGLPVVPVTSSKSRANIERGISAAIFFGYLLRMSKGLRRNGHIIAPTSDPDKGWLCKPVAFLK
jgi:hypothetical protein